LTADSTANSLTGRPRFLKNGRDWAVRDFPQGIADPDDADFLSANLLVKQKLRSVSPKNNPLSVIFSAVRDFP
jgi:hypothetical protein